MRPIEFRVWNGMEMVYDVTVGKFGVFYVNPENGNGLDPNDSASLSRNNTKYPDSCPVMQFTGLLDKNGAKIWEGDIIEWISSNPFSLKEKRKCKVFFSDSGLWWVYGMGTLKFYCGLGELITNERIEVTGTIYDKTETR